MIHQAEWEPSRDQLFHLPSAARVIPYRIVNGVAGGAMSPHFWPTACGPARKDPSDRNASHEGGVGGGPPMGRTRKKRKLTKVAPNDIDRVATGAKAV